MQNLEQNNLIVMEQDKNKFQVKDLMILYLKNF